MSLCTSSFSRSVAKLSERSGDAAVGPTCVQVNEVFADGFESGDTSAW